MNDKIVIITGANSGIGKAATIKFAREGYIVVMACRNLNKSLLVQKEIIELTNNKYIDLIELDISSFESIRHFCFVFKNKYQHLDILIHNAAYFGHGEKKYQLSPENIELSFATNTVGPFLMSQLLIDLLKKSDDARILHASSTNIRHFLEPKRSISFDNLQGEYKDTKSYQAYKMYGDSKMALLMLTFKMGELYRPLGVKVYSIQIPATKISKDTLKKLKFLWRVAGTLQSTISQSPETMGDHYFHICTSESLKSMTGILVNHKREFVHSSHYSIGLKNDIKQFFDKRIYPKYADNQDNIEKVWQLCVRLTQTN